MNAVLNTSIQSFPHVLRYALLALLVLFISLFFPNRVQFEYEYNYGERWRYEDLNAPFDFPILKSDEEIAQEQKALQSEFTPYYRLDSEALQRQKDSFRVQFRQAYQQYLAENPQTKLDTMAYLNFGEQFITHIYSRKLIRLDSAHLGRGADFVCDLLEDDMDLGEHWQRDFIQQDEASNLLIDTLSHLSKQLPHSKFMLPLLNDILATPNVIYDSLLTNKNRQNVQHTLSKYRGMVKTGELIVVQEGIIDSTIYTKLTSLQLKHSEEINQHKSSFLIYLGYLSLTIALLGIYYIFMHFYTPEVLYNIRHLTLLLVLIGFYAYISYLTNKLPYFNEYLIPFCIVPIVILNFFSANLALFTHIVIVLISSMLLSLDYQFILVQLIVGMVAIITKLKTRYLTDFFSSIIYIGLAYTAGFISLELIHTGAIFPIIDTNGVVMEKGVRWEMLTWIALNVFLTLLSYPLIPMLERVFGLTSEITLVELSDLNKPLLKELSIKAPGTLQHSLQVAHLAEAAASAIGANALLVRVAALYHDIGKMIHPEYFIENQLHNNPHQELSYLDSAKMIISHVTHGVRLARKHRLPAVLTDFILTHHGTTRVEYFYRMYMNENPTNCVSEQEFRYPGPRPRNREEAILMMADSLEAASRSLKSPNAEDIDNLVENIIRGKISHGQFNDTNLSFKELEQVKELFKKLLKSILHVRIEYPNEPKQLS